MKLITFKHNSKEQIGILSKNEEQVYPLEAFGINYDSMNDLIEKITDQEMTTLKVELEKDNKNAISVNDIEKMAPIPVPKQDIICLGINYIEHAKESLDIRRKLLKRIEKMLYIFQKSYHCNWRWSFHT